MSKDRIGLDEASDPSVGRILPSGTQTAFSNYRESVCRTPTVDTVEAVEHGTAPRYSVLAGASEWVQDPSSSDTKLVNWVFNSYAAYPQPSWFLFPIMTSFSSVTLSL